MDLHIAGTPNPDYKDVRAHTHTHTCGHRYTPRLNAKKLQAKSEKDVVTA